MIIMKSNLFKLLLLFLVFAGINFTTQGQVTTSNLNRTTQGQLNFAFLADLHVNPQSSTDTALHQIIDEINKAEYDFVVVAGDLTNTGSNAEVENIKSVLSHFNKPCYVIPGNHETTWSESAGLKFNRLFGNDRFIFRKNGFLLIGMNTGPFMRMGDGLVKQEDLQWLNRELQQAKTNDEQLIAITHYPLADGLSNWDCVTDILKKNNCILSLCGHGHRLVLSNYDGIPGIMGRAMMMQGSRLPGYNIVQIRSDSVYFYQKEVGKDKNIFKKFNYRNPAIVSSLPVSPKTDYKINSEYSGVKVCFQREDSFSIFSGTCIAGRKTLIYGNSVGKIKALRIPSQKIIWEKQLEGSLYSTPVVGKSVVAVGTADGKIIGFDLRNGKESWRVDVGTPVVADGVVENNVLYIGGGTTAFYKIDMNTGRVIWKFDGINGRIQGQPAISEKQVVFGAWDRYLYCLDKATGALLWKWTNGKTNVLYSPGNIVPAIANGKVFIVAPDNYMTAFDLVSGKQIWRDHSHRVRESMGISPDKSQVYAKLMNDSVIAVSTLTDQFKLNWVINAGFGYEHVPCPIVATNDQVFIGTRQGVVISINPRQQTINWKYKAGYSGVIRLTWDGKSKVYASLAEGKLVALKKE